jgi:steroid delta-isomerase-like uncharacterized protein
MTENERLARRFFDDVWTGGQYDTVDRLLGSDHLHHISGDTMVGREAVKDMARSMRDAFPDLRFAIEDTMVDGDKVLVRWTAAGTHSGDLGDLPGTGRRVEWTGMDLIRFLDGRIVELWGNNDALGLWEQLG